MMLLPPKVGTCPICATNHEPEMPHNAQSIYYQYRFYGIRGRWPTWADAIAHCAGPMKEHWRRELKKLKKWTEPEGDPIADPPAESICQAVGDISSTSFGPEDESA